MTSAETTVLAAVLAAVIASLPAWATYLTARSTRAALDRHAEAQTQELDAQTAALKDHITHAAAQAAPVPPAASAAQSGPDPEEVP